MTASTRVPTLAPRWKRWLRRCNPGGLVPAAIFEKEVRAQGRRWGTYVGRGLYASLLLGLLVIVFLGMTDGARPGKGARALQELQSLAPSLTIAVLWFQYVMLALMGPLLTGPSICDELRTGTLATLLTTPLTAAQIVLGKLLSAIVQIVILAALGTPMLLVIRVFGGVPVETILAGLALSSTTAVLGASLGVSASVRAKRGTTASVSGFLILLALHFGPLLIAVIVQSWLQLAGAKSVASLSWGFVTSGPVSLGILTSMLGGVPAPGLGLSVTSLWISNCVYSLVISVLAVLWAVVRLRRVMAAVGVGAPVSPGKAKKRQRAVLAAPGSPAVSDSEPAERLGRDRGDVSDRPVLWRELRQPLFSRARDFWGVTIAVSAIMIAIYVKVGIDEVAVHAAPLVIGLFIVLVQAATFSSATITGERESRTWDALLTTGLSPWGILLGKAAGTLKRTVYVPVFLGVLLCTVGIFSGIVHPVMVPMALVIFSAPVIFLTCTGVLASLVFRRGTHATAANAGLGLALWVGVPIVTSLLQVRHAETFLTVTNPMPLLFAAIDGAMRSTQTVYARDLEFRGPLRHSANLYQFTAYVVGFWVVYAGAGLGALRVGVAVFNRRNDRPS